MFVNQPAGGNPGVLGEQAMYTVEYYDDVDQRPTWCVVEWTISKNQKTGKTIERCGTQAEAESFAVAYMLIDRFTVM
jgi:hypothetical protein